MNVILLLTAALLIVAGSSYFDRWIGKGQDGRNIPVILGVLLFTLAAWLGGVTSAPVLLPDLHAAPAGDFHFPVARTRLPAWVASLAFGLAWMIWRTWDFGTHVINPLTAAEQRRCFRRHFLWSLPFLIPAYLAGFPLWLNAAIVVSMAVFAVVATKIGMENRRRETIVGASGWNATAERRRGLARGISLLVFLIPH